MALDRPLAPEASPVEPPSSYAELVVQLGPAQPWGTAKGKVPPEQAHHLITTFGIVSSVVAGITGTVLTLRIAPGLTGPAYAELALALAAAVLIAARRAAIRPDRPRGLQRTPAEEQGKQAIPSPAGSSQTTGSPRV